MNFKTVCGANNINPQVLLYDGHVSHFGNRAIHILLSHHIKPFIIKADESINENPNDNVPNLKLKGIYGKARINCQRQHRTPKFTTEEMNYVLVETWRYFQLSSAPVTINAVKKKNIAPLTAPEKDANTQDYLAATQTTKEKNRGN